MSVDSRSAAPLASSPSLAPLAATGIHRTGRRLDLAGLAERRWLPDAVVRLGLRRVMARRLRDETRGGDEAVAERQRRFVAELDASPIASASRSPDQRHGEVPVEFFRLHLGSRMKESSCLYATGRETLAGAEQAMFGAYAERAQLKDGQRILDLGCGWGSFALWAAARYRRSTIVALSNSAGQCAHIEAEAAALGIANLVVRTGDIVDFEFDAAAIGDGFDRIVSIELLEHLKNYRRLFAKLARWLTGDGRVFVHVIANRHVAYHLERESDDGMARHFPGGTMPSFDLFKRFTDDLAVEKRWWISGRHYERTATDWLRRLDDAHDPIMQVFDATYGREARLRFGRWRLFYMTLAELFGYDDGAAWGVAHYRFAKAGVATDA